MNLHLASTVAPAARLVVAIAPAFTIGLVRPSTLSSIAVSELNGSPVLFTPSLSRACSAPIDWQTNANTKGLDTLMIANSYSALPAGYTLPLVPTTQIPNNRAGTRARAGYTCEFVPSALDLY